MKKSFSTSLDDYQRHSYSDLQALDKLQKTFLMQAIFPVGLILYGHNIRAEKIYYIVSRRTEKCVYVKQIFYSKDLSSDSLSRIVNKEIRGIPKIDECSTELLHEGKIYLQAQGVELFPQWDATRTHLPSIRPHRYVQGAGLKLF